jgi:hypothetical protein
MEQSPSPAKAMTLSIPNSAIIVAVVERTLCRKSHRTISPVAASVRGLVARRPGRVDVAQSAQKRRE